MKRTAAVISTIIIVYIGSYFVIRSGYSEVWERDGKTYVLYPTSITYYLHRPLMYIDGPLTGMRFHIGPHQ